MPLPLIIGAIAGAATTLGVGAGIYGASKIGSSLKMGVYIFIIMCKPSM